jgi:hypothetical protein
MVRPERFELPTCWFESRVGHLLPKFMACTGLTFSTTYKFTGFTAFIDQRQLQSKL